MTRNKHVTKCRWNYQRLQNSSVCTLHVVTWLFIWLHLVSLVTVVTLIQSC